MAASSGRFSVETIKDDAFGGEAYVLRDLTTGSEARLAPAFGDNLYSFKVPVRGNPLEVFIGPRPGEGAFRGAGNPILFPWPNRIRDGRFTFEGKTYQMDVNPSGMALHGLVSGVPWKVESTSTSDGAAVTCSVLSTDHPNISRQWPLPFKLTVTYVLKGNEVRMINVAENVGSSNLPIGLGIHGWIRLPLSPNGRREDCLIKIPAAKKWEIEPNLLTTGRVIDTPPSLDFQEMRPLGSTTLDDLYAEATFENGATTSVLRDPAASAEVLVSADREFRDLVVFAPPTRPTICFEPYTCATDAFNLTAKGFDSHTIVLKPGETWKGEIWFTVREA